MFTIKLQAREGRTVTISRDAANLCSFVANILEECEGTDEPEIVIPAPGIADKHIADVVGILERFASNPRQIAFCDFLERARRREDAGIFRIGLGALQFGRTPTLSALAQKLRVKMIAFLEFLGADLPLIEAYSAYVAAMPGFCNKCPACNAANLSSSEFVISGRTAISRRFFCAGTWAKDSWRHAVPQVLSHNAHVARVPAILAPHMLSSGPRPTAADWLCLDVEIDMFRYLKSKHFIRSLEITVGESVKTVCIEFKGSGTDLRKALRFAENLKCQELVLFPRHEVGTPAEETATAFGALTEALKTIGDGATWFRGQAPRRLVVSTDRLVIDPEEYVATVCDIAFALQDLVEDPDTMWGDVALDVGMFEAQPGHMRLLAHAACAAHGVRFRVIEHDYRARMVSPEEQRVDPPSNAVELAEHFDSDLVLYGTFDAGHNRISDTRRYRRRFTYPCAEFREFSAPAPAPALAP